jgi:hypothetical protein
MRALGLDGGGDYGRDPVDDEYGGGVGVGSGGVDGDSDVTSWDVRDMHFADTVDACIAHHEKRRTNDVDASSTNAATVTAAAPVRAIVWAHNSHVGESVEHFFVSCHSSTINHVHSNTSLICFFFCVTFLPFTVRVPANRRAVI